MAELPITAEDIIALQQLNPATPVAGVARTGAGSGNASKDAISVAIRDNSVNVPSQPINSAADQAINVAATANQAVIDTTKRVMQEREVTQQQSDAVFNKLTAILEQSAADKGAIAAGTQEIANRNLAISNKAVAPVADIIAETARENARSASEAESILDKQRELREAPGIMGALKRFVVGDDLAEEYNAVAQEYNNRLALQQSLMASSSALASHEKSLLKSKTPEQEAAELREVKAAADVATMDAQMKQIDSREAYFDFQMKASTAVAGAAADTATRTTQASITRFDAAVQKIRLAADMSSRVAALSEMEQEVGGKLEVAKRVEAKFGLTAGEGQSFVANLMRVDDKAAIAAIQVSHSGEAEDANALARAYMYMPADKLTPSMKNTVAKIQENEGKYEAFLQTRAMPMTAADAAKLPQEQQMALRREFYATNEVPPTNNDAFASHISASIARVAPAGVIQIPATMAADGVTVARAPRTIKLAPTGELGKQLALLEGDGTAAVALAEKAVTQDKRNAAAVAKELSNFFQNALVVDAAYNGHERRQFKVQPATKFQQTVSVPAGLFGNTVKKNLDLADYPTMLTHLTKVMTHTLSPSSFVKDYAAGGELNNATR